MSGLLLSPWGMVALYLLTVNAAALMMFGWDRRAARLAMRRVSENQLLLVAGIGGTLGAKAGQHWLRHKTRKQPFRRYLNLILAAQIAFLCLLAWMVFQSAQSGAP